jgi:hypothetical protein
MSCAPGLVFGGTRASGPVSTFFVPGHIFDGTEGVESRFHVLRSRIHFRRYSGRLVPYSCFARLDSFSTVPMASGPVFMLCAPGHIFGGTWASVPFSCFARPDPFSVIPRALCLVFVFCAAELIFGSIERVPSCFHVFGGTEGVGSIFRFLRSPDLFSAIPRESGPVFTICAPGLFFSGSGDVGSRFLVLHARTHFRRYRGRRVPFSCFAVPDSFSAVPRSYGLVFMFCAPRLVFGGTEGVVSRFHVLLSRTRFRRYRGRMVPFSCFARPDSFSTVLRSSGPIFMFFSPGLVLGGTEEVPSRFHVFRSRTCFRRYRGRRVPFSCFALPDLFSAVPRTSGPVFTFCASALVFSGTGGVGPRFLVLCALTRN